MLGLAPGRRDDDYKASGVDHAARGRILDEQLAEMTRLWQGESIDGLGAVGPRRRAPVARRSWSAAA